MLNAKELDCFEVEKNVWVIRRRFYDEQGRRHNQFIAHLSSMGTDNKSIAEDFINGISALNERVPCPECGKVFSHYTGCSLAVEL